ncbi:hypothetical protein HDU86_001802, partial [Geranomyces michiganensis]
GATFFLYNVILDRSTYFFVELGYMPVVTSVYNAHNVYSALKAFGALKPCFGIPYLKNDAQKYDSGNANMKPTLYTASSPDGLQFQLYKVVMYSTLTLYVPLSKLPMVTSVENLALLSRCFKGFHHLKTVVIAHVENIKNQKRLHAFQPSSVVPITLKKETLLTPLREPFFRTRARRKT